MTKLHRTFWYMGVKARVIPGFLERVLEEEVPRGGSVVDLMSGTGIVSAFCAHRYRVLSNDVEEYAYVVARSLIDHDPKTQRDLVESIDPRADLEAAFRRNFDALLERYEPPLQREAALLRSYREGLASGRTENGDWYDDYRRYLETPGSVVGGPATSTDNGRRNDGSLYEGARELLLPETMESYRRDPRKEPYCLATAYYANIYFGLRQAMEIDSIRAAIAHLGAAQLDAGLGDPSELVERKRIHYLSALLHAASVCTSGTSHFAQPRHLRKSSELAAMARRRQIDIFEKFEEFSRDIAETVSRTEYVAGNHASVGDYRRFLVDDDRFEFPFPVDLVYLDPPYTSDHYSRFYHVLNVLARYDYPPLETDSEGRTLRGRYPRRDLRFQSRFCKRATVEDEFRRVIRGSAGCGAKLVISYASPSGLILKHYAQRFPGEDPVGRFEDLCREAYRSVETHRLPLRHSGQGDSSIAVDELLVVCRDPR